MINLNKPIYCLKNTINGCNFYHSFKNSRKEVTDIKFNAPFYRVTVNILDCELDFTKPLGQNLFYVERISSEEINNVVKDVDSLEFIFMDWGSFNVDLSSVDICVVEVTEVKEFT